MSWISRISVAALLLGAALSLPGCEDEQPQAPPTQGTTSARDAPAQAVTTSATFSEIYQIFMRRNLSTQEKSMLWATQYNDRWVRWTGKLVAFSPTGIKMRHLETTLTFDVSLIVNQPQRANLRKLLRVGQFYTYAGRLTGYDDLFRTLYLDQGVLVNPVPEGVQGVLVPIPPPLRVLPVDKQRNLGSPPAPDAGHPAAR